MRSPPSGATRPTRAGARSFPEVAAPAGERTAVDLLSEVLEPGGVTLLTLGPLTNAADAFRTDPGLAGMVESIVVMGGALDVAGNVPRDDGRPPTAEWNVFGDPTAGGEVLASGAPVVMVGLDATNRAPISGDFLDLLGVNAHTDAAKLVDSLIRNNPQVYTGEAYFWDPLAAALAVDPASRRPGPRGSRRHDGGADSGRTLRDPRRPPGGGRRRSDVPAFEEQIIGRWTGSNRGPSPSPDAGGRRRHPLRRGELRLRCPATIRPGRLRSRSPRMKPDGRRRRPPRRHAQRRRGRRTGSRRTRGAPAGIGGPVASSRRDESSTPTRRRARSSSCV